LARHSATLPRHGIPVAEFGSYLKFVNRELQCQALVMHLQSSYLTFRQRFDTPPAERAGPGEYLKAMQVVYSAGAPGIGKVRRQAYRTERRRRRRRRRAGMRECGGGPDNAPNRMLTLSYDV
jgi:hypothetical protein